MYSYGSPHMAAQKQDDQHERTFSSYVRIQVVVLKTCLGRWTIGRSGERGSGISVLPARYDDDDDDSSSQKHLTGREICACLKANLLARERNFFIQLWPLGSERPPFSYFKWENHVSAKRHAGSLTLPPVDLQIHFSLYRSLQLIFFTRQLAAKTCTG